MSLLLNIESIGKSFAAVSLYEDLSFSIQDDDKIALIGPNGSGKSTLLKILAGLLEPDDGKITGSKNPRVRYVPQKSEFDPKLSIHATLLQSAKNSHHTMMEAETAAKITAGKIGFGDDTKLVGELSGGWQKRLTIACALVTESDFYLFDEPTNHLDLEGTLWLEDMLKRSHVPWMLVSHDRKFINETARKVIELGKIFEEGCLISDGNYEDYVQNRIEYIESQERYRSSLANKVRRENEWLSRGPKARTTKAKSRIDSAISLQQELSQVSSRMQRQETDISFTASDRKTKKLIEIKDLTKSFEANKIVQEFSATIVSKMRVGILGANGAGKSTLLKMINGQVSIDEGSIETAQHLKVVYFDQHRDSLNPEWTLSRALAEEGDSVIYRGRSIHVASWARRFLFNHDDLRRQVKDLSGGEQARVLIANLMLREADILLLDEPTNDLDIETLEILEESLATFPGAILLVTHDRYMLERVCNTFIGLDGAGGAQIYSSYEQWQKFLTKKTTTKSKAEKQESKQQTKSKTKLSYKDQRDYDSIEERIAQKEKEIEDLQNQAADPSISTDSSKLGEIYKKIEAEQEELSVLYGRWEELEEMVINLDK